MISITPSLSLRRDFINDKFSPKETKTVGLKCIKSKTQTKFYSKCMNDSESDSESSESSDDEILEVHK